MVSKGTTSTEQVRSYYSEFVASQNVATASAWSDIGSSGNGDHLLDQKKIS